MTVASPDPRNIIGHVPGRFCYKASGDTIDLTTDYPHGGTSLGEIGSDSACIIDAPTQLLTIEPRGVEKYEGISGGEAISLAGILREFNPSAYEQVFLNASTGSTTGFPVVEGPGTNLPGYQFSGRASVFIFSPWDLDRHPMVVLYAGMPMIEETVELRFRLGSDSDRLEVPYVIIGTRDGSGRTYKCALRKDIANP